MKKYKVKLIIQEENNGEYKDVMSSNLSLDLIEKIDKFHNASALENGLKMMLENLGKTKSNFVCPRCDYPNESTCMDCQGQCNCGESNYYYYP